MTNRVIYLLDQPAELNELTLHVTSPLAKAALVQLSNDAPLKKEPAGIDGVSVRCLSYAGCAVTLVYKYGLLYECLPLAEFLAGAAELQWQVTKRAMVVVSECSESFTMQANPLPEHWNWQFLYKIRYNLNHATAPSGSKGVLETLRAMLCTKRAKQTIWVPNASALVLLMAKLPDRKNLQYFFPVCGFNLFRGLLSWHQYSKLYHSSVYMTVLPSPETFKVIAEVIMRNQSIRSVPSPEILEVIGNQGIRSVNRQTFEDLGDLSEGEDSFFEAVVQSGQFGFGSENYSMRYRCRRAWEKTMERWRRTTKLLEKYKKPILLLLIAFPISFPIYTYLFLTRSPLRANALYPFYSLFGLRARQKHGAWKRQVSKREIRRQAEEFDQHLSENEGGSSPVNVKTDARAEVKTGASNHNSFSRDDRTLIKPTSGPESNAPESGARLVKPQADDVEGTATRVKPGARRKKTKRGVSQTLAKQPVRDSHTGTSATAGRGPIPPDALALFDCAESASRGQNWVDAAEFYEKAFGISEPVPEARCQYGLVLNNLGRFGEAEAAFKRAIELDPTLANAYGNLGVLLVRDLGRPDEAEQMFLKALEIDPNHNARNNLAVLQQQRRGASVTRPEDERLPQDKEREADRLEERRMEGAALAIYLEFLRTHPKSLMALNNAAMLRLKIQQPDKALDLLKKAVELDPGYVKAWNNLGVARMQLGDGSGAREAFQHSLNLDPTNVIAKRGLSALQGR